MPLSNSGRIRLTVGMGISRMLHLRFFERFLNFPVKRSRKMYPHGKSNEEI